MVESQPMNAVPEAVCNVCGYRSEEYPNGSPKLRVCPACEAFPRQRSFKQLFDEVLEPQLFGTGSWCDALLLSPGAVERSLLEAKFRKPVLSSLYQTYKGNFVKADVRDLKPFRPASFDLVTASNVIDYVPEMDQAFAAIRRVLRPTGAFVFLILEHSLLEGDAPVSVTTRKAVTGNYWPDKDAVPDVSLGKETLKGMLSAAGFQSEERVLREPLSGLRHTWWICR